MYLRYFVLTSLCLGLTENSFGAGQKSVPQLRAWLNAKIAAKEWTDAEIGVIQSKFPTAMPTAAEITKALTPDTAADAIVLDSVRQQAAAAEARAKKAEAQVEALTTSLKTTDMTAEDHFRAWTRAKGESLTPVQERALQSHAEIQRQILRSLGAPERGLTPHDSDRASTVSDGTGTGSTISVSIPTSTSASVLSSPASSVGAPTVAHTPSPSAPSTHYQPQAPFLPKDTNSLTMYESSIALNYDGTDTTFKDLRQMMQETEEIIKKLRESSESPENTQHIKLNEEALTKIKQALGQKMQDQINAESRDLKVPDGSVSLHFLNVRKEWQRLDPLSNDFFQQRNLLWTGLALGIEWPTTSGGAGAGAGSGAGAGTATSVSSAGANSAADAAKRKAQEERREAKVKLREAINKEYQDIYDEKLTAGTQDSKDKKWVTFLTIKIRMLYRELAQYQTLTTTGTLRISSGHEDSSLRIESERDVLNDIISKLRTESSRAELKNEIIRQTDQIIKEKQENLPIDISTLQVTISIGMGTNTLSIKDFYDECLGKWSLLVDAVLKKNLAVVDTVLQEVSVFLIVPKSPTDSASERISLYEAKQRLVSYKTKDPDFAKVLQDIITPSSHSADMGHGSSAVDSGTGAGAGSGGAGAGSSSESSLTLESMGFPADFFNSIPEDIQGEADAFSDSKKVRLYDKFLSNKGTEKALSSIDRTLPESRHALFIASSSHPYVGNSLSLEQNKKLMTEMQTLYLDRTLIIKPGLRYNAYMRFLEEELERGMASRTWSKERLIFQIKAIYNVYLSESSNISYRIGNVPAADYYTLKKMMEYVFNYYIAYSKGVSPLPSINVPLEWFDDPMFFGNLEYKGFSDSARYAGMNLFLEQAKSGRDKKKAEDEKNLDKTKYDALVAGYRVYTAHDRMAPWITRHPREKIAIKLASLPKGRSLGAKAILFTNGLKTFSLDDLRALRYLMSWYGTTKEGEIDGNEVSTVVLSGTDAFSNAFYQEYNSRVDAHTTLLEMQRKLPDIIEQETLQETLNPSQALRKSIEQKKKRLAEAPARLAQLENGIPTSSSADWWDGLIKEWQREDI